MNIIPMSGGGEETLETQLNPSPVLGCFRVGERGKRLDTEGHSHVAKIEWTMGSKFDHSHDMGRNGPWTMSSRPFACRVEGTLN